MLGLIIGAVALLIVGFGGSWGVKHWKDGAEAPTGSDRLDE
jgi:hypothetical protein